MITLDSTIQYKGAVRQIMVDNNLRTINFKRWNMWNNGDVPENINSARLDVKGGIKIFQNSKGGYKGKEITDGSLWELLYHITEKILKEIDKYDVQERKNILIPIGR